MKRLLLILTLLSPMAFADGNIDIRDLAYPDHIRWNLTMEVFTDIGKDAYQQCAFEATYDIAHCQIIENQNPNCTPDCANPWVADWDNEAIYLIRTHYYRCNLYLDNHACDSHAEYLERVEQWEVTKTAYRGCLSVAGSMQSLRRGCRVARDDAQLELRMIWGLVD